MKNLFLYQVKKKEEEESIKQFTEAKVFLQQKQHYQQKKKKKIKNHLNKVALVASQATNLTHGFNVNQNKTEGKSFQIANMAINIFSSFEDFLSLPFSIIRSFVRLFKKRLRYFFIGSSFTISV